MTDIFNQFFFTMLFLFSKCTALSIRFAFRVNVIESNPEKQLFFLNLLEKNNKTTKNQLLIYPLKNLQ